MVHDEMGPSFTSILTKGCSILTWVALIARTHEQWTDHGTEGPRPTMSVPSSIQDSGGPTTDSPLEKTGTFDEL